MELQPFTLILRFLMDPGCASYQGSAAKTFTFSNPTAAEFSTLVSSLSSMKILYLNFPSRSSWDTRILVHLPIGGEGPCLVYPSWLFLLMWQRMSMPDLG